MNNSNLDQQQTQKSANEVLRDQFREKKKQLSSEIGEHRREVEAHQRQISRLEQEIKSSRPRIEDGDTYMICKSCDIYSMKYVGTQPGQGERLRWYECEICHRQDYHT